MAEASLLRAWWDRFRGRLSPVPCPFEGAAVLETPARSWIASPGKILGGFELTEGERVLEIGPGIGYYSVEACRRVGPSGRLICLDVQRDMLRETRRRLVEAGPVAAGFLHASAEDLPLASACLDRVFLITVLGEIPDRGKALQEIHRVLRPEGRLSVSEQLPDPDYITPGALRHELTRAGFRELATQGRLVYASTWQKVA
jgi:ubiquinone/menaquinone biosynthesis C-methylase UbiE